MKKLVLVAVTVTATSFSFSQIETSAFTSTGRAGVATTFAMDYQSVGINPANLGMGTGFEGKNGAISFFEGSYSVFSDALTKPELRDAVTNFETGTPFTMEQKQAAADAFTNTPLAINVDFMPFGLSIQPEDNPVGGFAFAMKERVQWYSTFNQTTSEILFLGYNAPYFEQYHEYVDSLGFVTDSVTSIDSLVNLGKAAQEKVFSDILDGSQIKMSWYREFNLSYGRVIIDQEKFKLYGGVGLKYLMGMALLDVGSEGGDYQAFASVSPIFDINWGTAAANNPSADTVNKSSWYPKPVGQGWGVDLGFTAVIGERLRIGAAVTDFGQMTWDVNVYSADDDTLHGISSEGFNTYNIFNEADDIVGEDGLFQWNGESKRTTKLPTIMRAGASYEIVEDKLEAGVDVILPFNDEPGNYDKAVIALGGDVYPFPWVRISAGFITGGNYGFNLPAGVTFVVGEGAWEAGVASRDVITFFTQNRPTLSLSVGFLRFRF